MTATEVRSDAAVPAATPRPRPTSKAEPGDNLGDGLGADLGARPAKRFSLLHVPRLPAAVRESRHRLLIAVLALHVPLLLMLGIAQHHGSATSAELAVPVVLATVAARFLHRRLDRSLAVVLGLAWSSYAVVYLDGGGADAYLHPLLVVVLVALYQDPLLLGSGVAALAAASVIPAVVQPDLVFARSSTGAGTPWLWTFVHVLAVVGVAAVSALAWRRDVPVPVFADPGPAPVDAELDPEVAEHILRARAAELALARRQATYALMTNLARRNQSLVGRQLATLDDLERDERDPDVLAGLFALDHLATRMRRNAENLLVLAGAAGGASRSFAHPVPVEELLRGAAAEVEQYARVTVSVGTDEAVAGHVVSDVAHLIAELLDNALACSPPDTQVVVGAAPGEDGALRLWVADEGIGMTDQRLAEYNALLSDATDEAEVGAALGFPVVKRLGARHGIHISLSSREGGLSGLAAYVDLPSGLVVSTPGATAGARTTTSLPLPGRRAAKHLPAHARSRKSRTALAAGAAHESVFQPAPSGADGTEGTAPEGGSVTDDAPEGGSVTDDATDETVAGQPAADEAGPGGTAPDGTTPGGATDQTATDDGPEHEVWATTDEWDEPVPSGGAHDHILFGSAPPPTLDELPPVMPLLEASLHTDRLPRRTNRATVRSPGNTSDNVLPAGSGAAGPLARRVPLQALRAAGGSAPLRVFEPAPQTAPSPLPAEPDPDHSTSVVTSYRVGVARGLTETATGHTDPDDTDTQGADA